MYDDISSAPKGREDERRGAPGTAFVYKIVGARAEEGASLGELKSLGEQGAGPHPDPRRRRRTGGFASDRQGRCSPFLKTKFTSGWAFTVSPVSGVSRSERAESLSRGDDGSDSGRPPL